MDQSFYSTIELGSAFTKFSDFASMVIISYYLYTYMVSVYYKAIIVCPSLCERSSNNYILSLLFLQPCLS